MYKNKIPYFNKSFWKLSLLLVIICSEHQSSAMNDEWETWPLSKLEHEVSPSKWNPRKTPDEVIKEYVDTSISGTLKAQQNVPNELNILYGSKATQQFDIYGTDLPSNAPIYLWCHGGYWQEGSKEIAGLLASSLHAKGVRNVVLGYTLAPSATVKEMEEELIMALKEIVVRYPEASITVGGHSAGGQLAAMLLHTEIKAPEVFSQIHALHLASGIFDLRPLVPTYVNSPLRLSRDTADQSSPLRLRKIRWEFLSKSSNMKISIVVGKYDSDLFQQQSQDYYKLLKKSFPMTQFWKSDSDDHFTLIQNMAKGDETESGKQFDSFVEEVKKLGSMSSNADPSTSVLILFNTILTLATFLLAPFVL